MEILGYVFLVIMGMTLGLVGAGGAILTIPILVYLFGIPIVPATSYSLFLVGSSAFVASIRYRHTIQFRKVVNFAVPSALGVFATRNFIIPHLPHSLVIISIDKALVILLLIFMGLAGYYMIKDASYTYENVSSSSFEQSKKIALIALGLGILMGLLGAGGGFLIIPTMVLLMGFTMQEAVPTSLFIITINSFIGFAADKHHLLPYDWSNLAKYLLYALLGMLIGLYIAKFIKGKRLKKAFGYFVWMVGTAILIKEFFL